MSLRPIAIAILFVCSHSPAGTVPVKAEGMVSFNSISSPLLSGVPIGAPVHMEFEVQVPGIVLSPGQYTNYPIVVSTFSMMLGRASVGLSLGGDHNFGLTNNFPAVDGIHWFTSPLSTPGHGMEFELFGGTGAIFTSSDITENLGPVDLDQFVKLAWNIIGPGGTLSIDVESVILGPPPEPLSDINDDGAVDGVDLGILLNQWETDGTADFNQDGIVDGIDLGILLNEWTL